MSQSRQFMLLFHEVADQYADLSPSEMQAIIEKFNHWRRELASENRFLDGKKLRRDGRILGAKDSDCANTADASLPGAEQGRVTDGPYSESKEILGGYFLIRADDYDHAIRLCRGAPAEAGRIEIREIESG